MDEQPLADSIKEWLAAKQKIGETYLEVYKSYLEYVNDTYSASQFASAAAKLGAKQVFVEVLTEEGFDVSTNDDGEIIARLPSPPLVSTPPSTPEQSASDAWVSAVLALVIIIIVFIILSQSLIKLP